MTGATAIATKTFDVRSAPTPAHHDSKRGSVNSIGHYDCSPVQVKIAPEDGPMYREQSQRTFRLLIRDALMRRVGVGRSITVKQLAFAVQLSEGTINNLMNGNNEPSGRALMSLLTFFDESFANEILAPTGCVVAKLNDRRAAALRQIAEGMKALKAMEGA